MISFKKLPKFCQFNFVRKTSANYTTDEVFESILKVFPSQNKNTIISPAKEYIFKVNNRNIRKRCEIRSKLTIKTTDQSQ